MSAKCDRYHDYTYDRQAQGLYRKGTKPSCSGCGKLMARTFRDLPEKLSPKGRRVRYLEVSEGAPGIDDSVSDATMEVFRVVQELFVCASCKRMFVADRAKPCRVAGGWDGAKRQLKRLKLRDEMKREGLL